MAVVDKQINFTKINGSVLLYPKLGGFTGVTLSVRLSVDAWLGKMVQSHKYFPFTPIIMKLHIQTPDESRM